MANSTLTFDVEWAGEIGAGIRAGSEVVTLQLEFGPADAELIEFFREAIAQYYDGATVRLRS